MPTTVLDSAKALVAPAMEKALNGLSPEIRRAVDYHMGWRDAAGNPVQRRGSKSVRPAFALTTARLGDEDLALAVPGALAVEFIHNWAFLIDDVMDGDRYRRQRETTWVVFGQGVAICSGSALLVLSQRVLQEAASPHRAAAVTLAMDTAAEMLAGQTLDMTFEQRLDVTLEECMAMTTAKTASLMRCAAAIGPVLTGAPADQLELVSGIGRAVGIAFQARDDLLGVWGRPEQTGGRPPGFDVRARKATLPIVEALAATGPRVDELRDLLGRHDLDDAAVARAAVLIEECGGRAAAADIAREMVGRAEELIDHLALDDQARADLRAVAVMGLPDDTFG